MNRRDKGWKVVVEGPRDLPFAMVSVLCGLRICAHACANTQAGLWEPGLWKRPHVVISRESPL